MITGETKFHRRNAAIVPHAAPYAQRYPLLRLLQYHLSYHEVCLPITSAFVKATICCRINILLDCMPQENCQAAPGRTCGTYIAIPYFLTFTLVVRTSLIAGPIGNKRDPKLLTVH